MTDILFGIKRHRNEPRAPFDVATVDAARVEAEAKDAAVAEAGAPSTALYIKEQLQTLPFLSSPLLVLLGLLLLAGLHTVGLLLFTRGFLLSRTVLEEVNDCNPILSSGSIDASCSLPPTHSKLVFIVIDALRADFILPVNVEGYSPSTYHHNRLTLPARLTKQDPTRSFLSHFIADAPTTTLQRLHGLTTGSLPTFVDAGSNFAGEKVTDDNWLRQAKRQGKRIALIGDDTWLAVYPKGNDSVWQEENVWPYDSFNVEDLDTVDRGVVQHLLPLLEEKNKSWDIIIAHTLGLDHVGHRFEPSHPEARRKLEEAETLLQNVVDRLDDDTLLIVMGDHGMTDRGDHGGDSRDEIDAGLWIYSKGPVLTHPSFFTHPLDSTKHAIAPLFTSARGSNFEDRLELDWPQKGIASTRSVSQVDIVPTLSLLLGLPIPFGSLGLVIPELFYHPTSLPIAPVPDDPATPKPKRGFFSSILSDTPVKRFEETLTPLATLLQASLLTSAQLSHYLAAYTSQPSGSDLLSSMPELTFILSVAKSAFRGAHAPGANRVEMELKALEKFWSYGRKAREKARKIWARFDEVSMIMGIVIWIGSVIVGGRIYNAASAGTGARGLIGRGVEGMLMATWMTVAIWLTGSLEYVGELTPLRIAFILALGTEIAIIIAPSTSIASPPAFALSRLTKYCTTSSLISALPVIAHSALFASNSFVVYEDASVAFILSTLLLVSFIRAFAAPEARLRKRLIGFSLTALVCVRLMSASTICREEQAPFCTPTFAQPAGSISALVVIGISFVCAWLIPTMLRRSLAISAADKGIAPVFFNYALRALLVGGVAYRAVDWTIAGLSGASSIEEKNLATMLKTGLARTILIGASLAGTVLWYTFPLCIEVKRTQGAAEAGVGTAKSTQVQIIGFANTFGSFYLLFFTSLFSIIFLVNGPTAQIVLTLHLAVLLCLLEIFDSERDVAFMKSTFASLSIESLLSSTPTALPLAPSHSGPTFSQLSTLALLAQHAFFTTGHQAAFSSIQWSSAFVGFPTVVYPISPILVVLNTLGSHIITALAIPLFVFWNVTPTMAHQTPLPLLRNLLRASVGYMTVTAIVAGATAVCAAVLRRHLMVWKVFAPRFMIGAVGLLVVDAVVIVFAVGWAGLATLRKVEARVGTKVVE